MRNIMMLLIVTMLLPISNAFSQYHVEISVNQPSALKANAGGHQSIEKGDTIQIGGNPSALGGYGNYSYAWSPESSLNDDTLANPMAWPDESTDYILTVKDSLNCRDSDTVDVSVVVTNVSTTSDKEVDIYPNPALDELKIDIPGDLKGVYKIDLVDLHGRTIYSDKVGLSGISKYRLNLDVISSGVYIVKIKKGNEKITAKIIVR